METLRQTYRKLIGLGALALFGVTFVSGQNPRALFPQNIFQDSTIRISYLLPLAARENLEQGMTGDSKQLLPFLEFYQGGILALQYWRELGYTVDAQLIDTKSPEAELSDANVCSEDVSIYSY